MVYGLSGIVWNKRMWDNLLTVINILAMLLAGTAFYFNNTSAMSERMAIVETRVSQEMIGYRVLQDSTSERLKSLEKKVDCLLDKRMCH